MGPHINRLLLSCPVNDTSNPSDAARGLQFKISMSIQMRPFESIAIIMARVTFGKSSHKDVYDPSEKHQGELFLNVHVLELDIVGY